MTPATILFKSFVTLLNVAGPCLYRRALASVVEAVTGTTTLLNSIATCGRAGGPLRPGRPAIVSRVAGPAPWAAFTIRNCGVGAGHDGTGHLFADGNRVLAVTLCATVYSPLLVVLVLDSIVKAEGRPLQLTDQLSVLFRHFSDAVLQSGHDGAQALQFQDHAG